LYDKLIGTVITISTKFDWLTESKVLLLSLPVTCYFFGLLYGSTSDTTEGFNIIKVGRFQEKIKVLPILSIGTIMSILCAYYLFFFGTQFQIYMEGTQANLNVAGFARDGFFDLVTIAFVNLMVIVCAHFFCEDNKFKKKSRFIKGLTCLLSFITLGFILLSLDKMLSYIKIYGLTDLRLLPTIVIIYLACVLVSIILGQFENIDVMKFAVYFASVTMVLVLLISPEQVIIRYNASRFLKGTLKTFDVTVLNRAGISGVDAAIKVYEHTSDEALKKELKKYMIKVDYRVNNVNLFQTADSIKASRLLEDFR
jgi:hypothetical protein